MPHHKQWIVANRSHMLELSYAVERTIHFLGQWLMESGELPIHKRNEIIAGKRDIYALQKLIKSAPPAPPPPGHD